MTAAQNALLDEQGTLCGYCPERFDRSAILSLLLDAGQGGYWAVEGANQQFVARAYNEPSTLTTPWPGRTAGCANHPSVAYPVST